MRKHVWSLFLLFALIATDRVHAQVWERIGVVDLRCIERPSPNKILIGTGSGFLYRSEDNGSSWHSIQINNRAVLGSMRFRDEHNGVIGSSAGLILLTTNGGDSWTPRQTSSPYAFTGVAYSSDAQLFACGPFGSLFYSSDAGITWNANELPTRKHLTSITFLANGTGLITGDSGCVFVSTDNGSSWQDRSREEFGRIPNGHIDLHGRVALGGMQLRLSTDLGLSWTSTSFADSLGGIFQVVRLLGTTEVVGFQNNFFWFRSTDQAKTWSVRRIDGNNSIDKYVNASIYDASINDENEILLAGGNGTIARIFKDQFKVERQFASASTAPIVGQSIRGFENNLRMINQNHGGLLISTDYGTTWITRHDGYFGVPSILGLNYSDSANGVLFARNTLKDKTGNYYSFYRTTNNGLTWEDFVPPHANLMNLTSAHGRLFLTSDTVVFVSSDGGLSWTEYAVLKLTETARPNYTRKSSHLQKLEYLGDGVSALLIQGVDSLHGGNVMEGSLPNYSIAFSEIEPPNFSTIIELPERHFVRDMYFHDRMRGVILLDSTPPSSAYYGHALATTDGGKTWTRVVESDDYLSSIDFKGSYGIIAGGSGTLFWSADSGKSWNRDSVVSPGGVKDNFVTVFFASDSVAIVTGWNSLYRKQFTPSSETKRVKAGYGNNEYLYLEVYPIPAQTTLTINLYGLYSISPNELMLGIYDVLGRRVMDLTEKARQSSNGATASIEVNTLDLPAGTYLVWMTASDGSRLSRIVVIR